jgi:hypothetical protein
MSNVETISTELQPEHQLDRNTLPSVSLILTIDDPSQPISTNRADLLCVDEIVLLVTGPSSPPSSITDEARSASLRLPNQPSVIVADLTYPTYPHLYQTDLPETYTHGRPLLDENPNFETSGLPTISNWAYVRELGLSLASSEWCLFLHNGETLATPEYLRSACLHLTKNGRTVARSQHESPSQSRYRTVLVRNRQGVTWKGPALPEADGRPTIIDGSLGTICQKDTTIDDVKILYARTRRRELDVSPLELAQLASISHSMGDKSNDSEILWLSQIAADACLATSEDPEISGWAYASKGRWYFHKQAYQLASLWYEKSLRTYPSWKSALRLSRSRFMSRDWRACLEAYNLAVQLREKHVLIHDDGKVCPKKSLIFVASALKELGMTTDARSVSREILRQFPNRPGVENFVKSIG